MTLVEIGSYLLGLLDILVIRLPYKRLATHFFHVANRVTTRLSSTISNQQELLRYRGHASIILVRL